MKHTDNNATRSRWYILFVNLMVFYLLLGWDYLRVYTASVAVQIKNFSSSIVVYVLWS